MHFNRINYVAAFFIVAAVGSLALFLAFHGNGPQQKTAKQLWHCGMHPQVIQDHPGECPICHMALTRLGADGDASHGGPEVQIDPALVQNMGIRTAKVMRGPLARTVRTVGLLKLPEPGLHDVALKVGGWIDTLYADREGMHVEKGQPLFEIYSQELQVTEQELISSVKSEKSLGASASPALKQEGHDLIESAKRKLRLLDVAEQDIEAIANADQAPRDVPFRSPATGHIEEKMIVQGSAIQPGMKLLRIADHTTMWLEAQVYPEQFSVMKAGHETSGPKIVATIDGIPGKTFTGAISFINPHIDHMTRTLTVRITLENPDLAMKPGMYATVEIITQPVPDAIQVPHEAVIDTGTRQIVFISEEEGHFMPRTVRTGVIGDDDKVEILEGLAVGETVVTSGQFLLDVESRTIEATQKLTAAPMAEVPSTQPTPGTQPASDAAQLSLAYCPMVKANWLQEGDAILNPYMGAKMLDCGSVKKKLALPPVGSDLSSVMQAYLDIAKGLAGDTLNTAAIAALRAAADKLPADKFAALKRAAEAMTNAKDIKTARSAFKTFSGELIAALERNPSPLPFTQGRG